MKAFLYMSLNSFKMLLRNKPLLISSFGVAILSIFAFGFLLGGGGNFKLSLGIVKADGSTISNDIVTQLRQNAALNVTVEGEAASLEQLRSGHRDAVIILPPNFGTSLTQGNARMKVYYNQSNPTSLAITRQAVQSIVEGINRSMTHSKPPLTVQEEAVNVHDLRQIDFILPGMLGLMLMWGNLSAGTTIIEWRDRGVLRRLAATPLPVSTLISAQLIARLMLALAQAALIMVIGMSIFKVQMLGNWGILFLSIVLGSLTMMAIGFGIGSIAKNAEAAQSITFLVSFPMMFLGGSYFPVSAAPDFIKPIINLLPLTYLNDALRQIINNGASLPTIQADLLVLLGWVVVGLLLSLRTFRWSR